MIVSSDENELTKSHRSEISVLFCDLRKFSTLIESLGPERAFAFVNRYLAAMEPTITS